MWVGSAEGTHFSFMNQPRAAGRNFRMFAQSLAPLLDAAGQRELRAVIGGYDAHAEAAMRRAAALDQAPRRSPSGWVCTSCRHEAEEEGEVKPPPGRPAPACHPLCGPTAAGSL